MLSAGVWHHAFMHDDALFWKIHRGEVAPPPAADTLGFRIVEVDPEKGTIAVEFQASEGFVNPAGTIQGGFLAAMLDDTMGPCIVATLGVNEFAPTLDLHVTFHGPGKPGKIRGTAYLTHRGKRVISARGELRQEDRLLATGQATAMVQKLGR